MPKKRGKARHPLQPLITAPDGVVRFKPNKIVQHLIDVAAPRMYLNTLACMNFSNEDWAQFSQLTGNNACLFPNPPATLQSHRQCQLLCRLLG